MVEQVLLMYTKECEVSRYVNIVANKQWVLATNARPAWMILHILWSTKTCDILCISEWSLFFMNDRVIWRIWG